MNRQWLLWSLLATVLLSVTSMVARAQLRSAENTLSSQEKQAGWILLFNGKNLDGWQTSSRTPSKVPVEDGAINPHGCGGYMMIHEKTWADFVMMLDFKISKGCNSGVFIRTYPLTRARARMPDTTASRLPSMTPRPRVSTTRVRSTTWLNPQRMP